MTTKSWYGAMLSWKWSHVSPSIKLAGLCLVSLVFLTWIFQDSNGFHRLIEGYISSPESDYSFLPGPTRTNASKAEAKDGSVINLIYDIREAVKVASGGSNISFSAEERKAWEEKFPCRSRVELESFYEKREHVRHVPLNKRWQEVLAEYAVLHRVCMSKVGDLKKYFKSKNDSTGCQFLVAEAHFGLGNKVLHMSSLLVHAVLTQRVILIPSYTSVPRVMCEPFPGSSWSMPDHLHNAVKTGRASKDELHAAIDEDMSTNQSMNIYAAQGGGKWGPEGRFWCDTEQKMYSKVRWLTFDGCLHHLPKLFAILKFRRILEEIFPTRIVLTHVLRTAMLPADPVWERIVDVMKDRLGNAEKLVGVQVRFLHGLKQYKKDNSVVNGHITRCLWDNGFLPEVCPAETTKASATVEADSRFVNCSALDTNTSAPVTKVHIASQFLGFHDYLENLYPSGRYLTVDRGTISIVQLSSEKTQGSGVDEDTQALVEVIALSFSDVLLVTPFSTFGGLAQGYGTLVPYFVEYNTTETEVPCQQGMTTEPCYLGAMPFYDCRYDPQEQGDVNNVVPYLQRCMYIDVGPGYAMLMMNENHDKL